MTSRSHLSLPQPALPTSLALAPGTAAAPALSITGDADSGLFAPAADTLALTVGGGEAVRVSPNRNLSIGTTTGMSARLHIAGALTPLRCDHSGDNGSIFYGLANSPLYAGNGFTIDAVRTASNTYSFLYARSSVGSAPDVEFNLSGNGTGYCDGSWTGGGADYAEYFEWEDGNPAVEDRRGLSVILIGNKIRPAAPDDPPSQIIGIVSATPSMVGDAAWNVWAGKYQRDAYGAIITEPVELVRWVSDGITHLYPADATPAGVTVPADAARIVEKRRVLNPDFDPNRLYQPREERPEWSAVGLLGKLRLRTGQPVGQRWIRLRASEADVEEWLVR